ncbi:hypothetical protein PLICRDRAFT_178668 [Plicaturopsis crispa FD-325 SS-3]|nr:hypothetical protein PLICRDRAFT_178668 [Plicaturopsis crispa FD-325 SS-3]
MTSSPTPTEHLMDVDDDFDGTQTRTPSPQLAHNVDARQLVGAGSDSSVGSDMSLESVQSWEFRRNVVKLIEDPRLELFRCLGGQSTTPHPSSPKQSRAQFSVVDYESSEGLEA